MSDVVIVNVGYRSTNFWVIGAGPVRLMVDLGWPGMWGALTTELKRKSVPLGEIRYGFATHFHMDHAGLAENLKQHGMQLITTPEQQTAIPVMKTWMKDVDDYLDIVTTTNLIVAIAESRAFLASIGVSGQLVHTPGHSDDSVSLLLDSGDVFTGDLTHPSFATEDTIDIVDDSWLRLSALGAKTVYAGHGPVRPMPV